MEHKEILIGTRLFDEIWGKTFVVVDVTHTIVRTREEESGESYQYGKVTFMNALNQKYFTVKEVPVNKRTDSLFNFDDL
jgi:hypothetical protein